jgi:hypothetical protein
MTRAWVIVFLPILVGMGTPEFRFSRPIEAAPGWCELELPDDVLEATRPGLPDLRIRAQKGGEDVPFIDRAKLPAARREIPLVDVETAPNKETTAVVDRGPHPGWADALELDVAETEFAKPVKLEASPDRAVWNEIARTSIFATAGSSMTKVRFAPNDRRYLRLRFDDKNGAPIHAEHATLAQSTEHPASKIADVEWKSAGDADPSVSTYAFTLRSANAPVIELHIGASDAAFAREVRVFERVISRDEVSRRLLGQGEIIRSADGREATSVTIAEPSSRNLEVDIDRGAGVPLHVTSMSVAFEPRVLVFHAPTGSELDLLYGSSTAQRPHYDLDAALAKGRPAISATAHLGPAIDTGATAPAIARAPRGASLDLGAWRAKQSMTLPAHGPVAYVDVDRDTATLSDVRIVDEAARQVPYVVESNPRRSEVSLGFRREPGDRHTVLVLTGLDPEKTIDTVAIDVASPDYFAREAAVVELVSDPRGPTEERVLGHANLERTADASRPTFRIPIAHPTGVDVRIRIEDGDNAPLVITAVRAVVVRRRIDFLFEPGDRLTLLSDNPLAGAPRYDLALVSERMLSSPAEAATLDRVVRANATKVVVPRWFWLFVVAAALLLFLAVRRALGPTPSGAE